MNKRILMASAAIPVFAVAYGGSVSLDPQDVRIALVGDASAQGICCGPGGPPPGGGGSSTPGATEGKGGGGHKSNAGTGKTAVGCIWSSAFSTWNGARWQGASLTDPRSMTARESAVNMIKGCVATAVFAGAWLPYRDNDRVLQAARLETVWENTEQGRSFAQTCMRGAADGCNTNGKQELWVGQWYAYHHNALPKGFAKKLQKQGIQVTARMVRQAEKPLIGKNAAVTFNAKKKHKHG
ncbi:MAG: hypothetical protein HYS26_00915 [Candidatus Kaiserbacteria bacterium]|nr:MAG: hypothetical protein HYS26_00915 [Candidatus Kaiserbacteria bacterium]